MIGNKVCFFQTLESTNSHMKKYINTFQSGDIICAKVQTAGKGRRSNIWMSNDGDLHISLYLDNTQKQDSLFDMILMVTTTLVKVLRNYGVDAAIKYPNDIVVGKRKIAGILIEHIIGERDQYVIGIGLNIVTEDFSRIEKLGTSIYLETGKTYDYRDVLQEFINIYNDQLHCLSCDLYNDYLSKNVVIGKQVVLDEEEYLIKTINLEGKVVLVKGEKEITKHMNEFTFKEYYNEQQQN